MGEAASSGRAPLRLVIWCLIVMLSPVPLVTALLVLSEAGALPSFKPINFWVFIGTMGAVGLVGLWRLPLSVLTKILLSPAYLFLIGNILTIWMIGFACFAYSRCM